MSRPRLDHAAIPEGIAPDAAQTWPPRELIDSFLGSFDFSATSDVPGEELTEFRSVLGRFASGVTIVTASTVNGPVGMTLQSFTALSLRPPLILFAPAKTSRAWPLIHRTGHFTVNLLGVDQEDLSTRFAMSQADKFAGVDWTPSGQHGDPQLAGCIGWIDCAVHNVHAEGDHYIVVGRVLDLVEGEATDPLLFYRSGYRKLD
ncbi:MAG TPA: flavin reductase family protein [Aeromicrobium sp.]|nr:flavin reductase family protein [Aeromicrobium sp.]HKY57387.1 flavin reductase family protein [Aeromicrobium sp.]